MSDEEIKLQDVENEIPEKENVPDSAEDNNLVNQSSANQDEEDNFTTLHMVDVPNLVKNMGLQQRYWFYCNEWRLSTMIVDEIQSAVLDEVSAAIRPIEDEEVIVRTEEDDESHFWKIIDVDLGIAFCQSLEREEHQEEIDIRDLNLTYMNDVDQQVAESRALAIHMYSFFTNIIHRPWDRFSDASESEFEPILRRRLNLFGLDCDDSLRHLMFRNDRELYFFNHMLHQLYQLHDILQKIPQEDEKIFERVYNDYVESYSICKVHGTRLQKMEEEIWQQYQILKEGKSQIVRRKNGPRLNNTIVYHLIGHEITTAQINTLKLPDDSIIKTYDEESFGEALKSCFENDHVILFPGVYSFEEHLFHESINIRGIGEKPDDVIIQSEEGEGYFVFCDSENIFFENLTLEGRRNFEGALVINGGQCNLINVNISCDMVTRGIIVRPFAVCKVQDIKIEGDHTASICLENAAELHESGNNNFDAEIRFDQLPSARHLKKDSPITPRQLNLPVREMQGLDIGTKIASPRVDPSEGAGDTFTA